jgi:uncharacterized membrane protein
MDYHQTATTAADIDRAWAALAQVTTYPTWTASVTSVDPLDSDALRVGHRFRIRQPGLPPVVWRVSDVRDGESFTWEVTSPGIRTVGYHRLARNADGGTEIILGLRQTGPLSGLMRLLTAAKTRRYLAMEAAGLKAAAEAVPATGGA